MPAFEINSDSWKWIKAGIKGERVASVQFNEQANTTEIVMKDGASYEVTDGSFAFEYNDPKVIPVTGTVEEVKAKLGLEI